LTFTGFWYFKVGENFEYLLYLIFAGIFGGVFLGICLAPIIAGVHFAFSKVFGKNSSFRNSFGITSYSFVPILFSLAIVLPIELLTFGLYLFSANPHPFTIKPLEYSVLVGVDAFMGVWSIALAAVGTKISQQSNWVQAILVVSLTVVAIGGGLLGGGFMLLRLLVR
jgi:hypothetical protein